MSFEIKDGILERYRKEEGVTKIEIPNSVRLIGSYVFFVTVKISLK